jgi:hypothetical protein
MAGTIRKNREARAALATTVDTNYGEYQLIVACIAYAIHEASSYRNPRRYQDIILGEHVEGYGRPGSREIKAYKARKWINTKNRVFTFYCNLLGWSAPWVRKKINDHLARIDAR